MTEETPSGVNLRETLGLPTKEQVKKLLTEFPGKKEGKSGWQADLSVYGETSERLRQTALSGGRSGEKISRLEATVVAINSDLKGIPGVLGATVGFLREQIREVGLDPSSKEISLVPLAQQAVERQLGKTTFHDAQGRSEEDEAFWGKAGILLNDVGDQLTLDLMRSWPGSKVQQTAVEQQEEQARQKRIDELAVELGVMSVEDMLRAKNRGGGQAIK